MCLAVVVSDEILQVYTVVWLPKSKINFALIFVPIVDSQWGGSHTNQSVSYN